MSEPTTVATRVEQVAAGLFHWTILDERIGFRSDAWAVESDNASVWIDPLPISEEVRSVLPSPQAICITGAFHQRAAWTLRRTLDVPAHAPRHARGLLEPADRRFDAGAKLPAALLALDRPGPQNPHYVFLHPHGFAFIGDLLMRSGREEFAFVPDEHHEDPRQARCSVASLLDLSVEILCPAHGEPQLGGVERALRRVLRRDAGEI